MFKHVKTKILLFITPVIIISILASSYVALSIGNNALSIEIDKKMRLLDELKTTELDSNIKDMEKVATSLASSMESTYINCTLEDYEKMILSVMELNPILSGVAIVFEPYVLGEEYNYAAIYASLDQNGNVYSEVNYTEDEYKFYKGIYYENARQNDKFSLSTPFTDSKTGVEIICASMPIHNSENEFIGAVILKVPMETIRQIVDNEELDDIEYYVLDEQGVFYIHPKAVEGEANIKYEDLDSNLFTAELLQDIFAVDAGTFSYTRNDKNYTAYYNTIDGFKWKIVEIVSDDVLEASMKTVVLYSSLLAIVIILFTVLLLFYVIRRGVERPIKVLIDEFHKIANHTFVVDAPKELEHFKDEFGVLGQELKTMKERLENFEHELEDSLEENYCFAEEVKAQNDILIKHEEELNETLLYKKALLDSFPDTVFILSKDLQINDVRGTCTSSILDGFQLKGKYLSEILVPEIYKEFVRNFEIAFKTDETISIEHCLEQENLIEHFDLRFTCCTPDIFMLIARNLSELKQHEKRVAYLTNYDQFTGLYNKDNIRQVVQDIIDTECFPSHVIIADIVGLKIINSSFGYRTGDLFITEFASVLKKFKTMNTELGYIGAGSFLIVIKNSTEDVCNKFIKEVKDACNNQKYNELTITAAFGMYCIEDTKDTVDIALYKSEERVADKKVKEYSDVHVTTIEIINRTLQAKSPREQYHSERVAELAKKFASAYGLTEIEQNNIYTAGLLHDIGKIGIPENILDKPGKLTDEEYFEMKKHPQIGYEILEASGNMKNIANIIVAHHERWDGKGYPNGLKGTEIHLKARMIGIIDAFDAMVSDRSYRKGMPVEVAVEEIRRCAGAQFDPDLVEIFINKVIV